MRDLIFALGVLAAAEGLLLALAPGVLGEGPQQAELGAGELHQLPVHLDLVG